MVDVPPEADARRKAQADEYGQFVATQRIYVDGALAFTPGHPVPASHVVKYGYDKRGLVRRVGAVEPATGEAKADADDNKKRGS